MGSVRQVFCHKLALARKREKGLMGRMKDSGEQYDDRIIEVHWDTEAETWKMMRMRDDKPDANHKSILEKILISIKDGVEIDAVSLFGS